MAFIDKLLRYTKRAVMVLTVPLLINTLSIPFTLYSNNHTKTIKKTAVFTSGYDRMFPGKLISKTLDFIMYTPITLKQNLKGNHVDWYSNSTKKQILDVLQNSAYQNIVFIGHGNNSTYCATDEELTAWDLEDKDLPFRKGEFIQHTCGGGYGKSLRKVLYPNGSEGYGFNRKITGAENYWKALVELAK